MQSTNNAGMAAGALMEHESLAKAGCLEAPQEPCIAQHAEVFELGVTSVIPNPEVAVTYIGDSDDSAAGVEGPKAMSSAGVQIPYPLLGGATNPVYREAMAADVPTLPLGIAAFELGVK